jgi:hypothetical protein
MFNSQLDLFTPPVYQGELLGYEYQTLRAETKSGPIVFKLVNNKEYIDLSHSLLCVRAKIVASDGSALGDKVDAQETQVAFVNNAMHSLFSDVVVKLSDKRIEGGRPHYPYKSYISTAFRLHEKALKNQAFTQGWVKDDYDKMEEITNTGYVARKAWTDKSELKEFFGKLDVDFFKQDRLLPPGVDLEIIMERAKDSFSIFCKNEKLKPKVEIDLALLQLRTVKVHPEIMASHMDIMSQEVPVIYPINRVELSYVPMKKDDKDLICETLFHGRVPKYLVMTLLSKSAFHGDYTKNPFNFKHYNLCSLSLKKNKELCPYEEFKPDFKNKKCIREYISLYESNGIFGKDETIPISYDEFIQGYTHFQWNLSNNGRGTNTQADERGNLVLKLEFAEAVSEPVVVLFYAVFDGTVYLYGDGVVKTDYEG